MTKPTISTRDLNETFQNKMKHTYGDKHAIPAVKLAEHGAILWAKKILPWLQMLTVVLAVSGLVLGAQVVATLLASLVLVFTFFDLGIRTKVLGYRTHSILHGEFNDHATLAKLLSRHVPFSHIEEQVDIAHGKQVERAHRESKKRMLALMDIKRSDPLLLSDQLADVQERLADAERELAEAGIVTHAW